MTLEVGFGWLGTAFRLLGLTSQTFEICDLSLKVGGHKDHVVLLEGLFRGPVLWHLLLIAPVVSAVIYLAGSPRLHEEV
jgi:hypothetical protein